ncbi:MAG: hypothetical protein KC636_05175, partial [Myxococcales bacterium]|nr:hypothetical protein [Myxococcales bacterium]
MEFKLPSPEQFKLGIRAVYSVAIADGPIGDGERAVLAAAARVIGRPIGVDIDLDRLTPITPAALAAAIDDPQIRYQLIGAMVVMTFADADIDGPEVELVEAFARALDVKDGALTALRHLAEERLLLARLDTLRRFWGVKKIQQIAASEGLSYYWKAAMGAMRRQDDPTIAARYRALEASPPGSLGRAYYDYMISNGFPFPGERGSAPEVIVFH